MAARMSIFSNTYDFKWLLLRIFTENFMYLECIGFIHIVLLLGSSESCNGNNFTLKTCGYGCLSLDFVPKLNCLYGIYLIYLRYKSGVCREIIYVIHVDAYFKRN